MRCITEDHLQELEFVLVDHLGTVEEVVVVLEEEMQVVVVGCLGPFLLHLESGPQFRVHVEDGLADVSFLEQVELMDEAG